MFYLLLHRLNGWSSRMCIMDEVIIIMVLHHRIAAAAGVECEAVLFFHIVNNNFCEIDLSFTALPS